MKQRNKNAQSRIVDFLLESQSTGYKWPAVSTASSSESRWPCFLRIKACFCDDLQYPACCKVIARTSPFMLVLRFARMDMDFVQPVSSEREHESWPRNPAFWFMVRAKNVNEHGPTDFGPNDYESDRVLPC